MNKKNVRKLINRLEGLLDSPQAAQFNMEYFGDAYFNGMRNVLEVPMCHTQACLAGEALLSTGQAEIRLQGGLVITTPDGIRHSSGYVEEAAKKSLGLTEKESNNLFYLRSMLVTKENTVGRKNSQRHTQQRKLHKGGCTSPLSA